MTVVLAILSVYLALWCLAQAREITRYRAACVSYRDQIAALERALYASQCAERDARRDAKVPTPAELAEWVAE